MWIDVSDLFWFFSQFHTPSGIQRLTVEASVALYAAETGKFNIALCRIDEASGRLRAVSPTEMLDLFRQHKFGEPVERDRNNGSWPKKVAAEFRRLLRRRVLPHLPSQPKSMTPAPSTDIASSPGDVLLCMGSHWVIDGYSSLVRNYRYELGLRFALLCYDLIPLLHPQWISKTSRKKFRDWFDKISVQADVIMTISRYTATQVQDYMGTLDGASRPIVPIRIGHGFPSTVGSPIVTVRASDPPLNLVDPFALFVSTIEPRKNHLFLVKIWQQLLQRHSRSIVPQLVFVGRQGGMVGELLDELNKTNFIDGKVRIVHNVSDAWLNALYNDCTLTIYPSLEEGFGLPVAEAVMAGAICIASNKTSIPEVVGDAIEYFDPDDFDAAYCLIERAIFDEGFRAELFGRVKNFKPRPWNTTARDILSAVERHVFSET
jgi:glycosyltransferase involved in cell wall biosynthesis